MNMINCRNGLVDQDVSWRVLVYNNADENMQKELRKTQNILDRLLHDYPDNADFLFFRGIVDFRLGHTTEAESRMEKAAVLKPRSAAIAFIHAAMCLLRGKYAPSLLLLMRVISLNPDHLEAYWLISQIFFKFNDLPGALSAINMALKINPDHADAVSDKGNILKKMGRVDEAAACFKQAMQLKPDDHRFVNNLGVIRFLQNDLDGAEALYQKVLAIQPACAETLSNLCAIQRLKGDFGEALINSQKALALRPDYSDGLTNLGNLLKDLRHMEEAISAYRRALRLDPDNAEIHKNYSMALLAAGYFDEGWSEYKWRWKSNHLRHALRDLAEPEWQGEAGRGRTILIRAEQGLGDSLQFCRYVPDVKILGFRVIMEVPPPLKRIMHSLAGVDGVVTTGETIPHFDLHCPMMNLPMIFQTTLETIPAGIPYLSADPKDLPKWRDRVASAASGKLKVGLTWAGSSRSYSPDLIATDRRRSITPEILAPLMDVPGVQFFSLQKDRNLAPEHFPLIDWMEECHDLADTAALITHLDLVISVDTAIAHLAGALGKPVWIMNRFNSCWRWLIGRDDSPWYPSLLRLFNQKDMGNWDEVITRIRTALQDVCKKP